MRLERLEIHDEGFVFDPATGESFRLNATALEILKAWRAQQGDTEIAEAIGERYRLPARTAIRDLADFRGRARSFGLV